MNEKKISASLLRLVGRPKFKDGKPVMKEGEPELRAIKADEVLDWAETDTHVTVVTVDGQRFRGEKPAEKPARSRGGEA